MTNFKVGDRLKFTAGNFWDNNLESTLIDIKDAAEIAQEIYDAFMAKQKTVFSPYLEFGWTIKKYKKDKFVGTLCDIRKIDNVQHNEP